MFFLLKLDATNFERDSLVFVAVVYLNQSFFDNCMPTNAPNRKDSLEWHWYNESGCKPEALIASAGMDCKTQSWIY
jgi:hypothetical protein